MQATRYSYFRRLVHWAAALSVLCLLGAGLVFAYYGSFDELQAQLGADNTALLFKYHKSLGVLVFILAWLIYRMRKGGVPAYDPPQSFLVRWPARLVAWLMVLGMLIMPLLGFLATQFGGHPVPFFEWTIPNFLPEYKGWSEALFAYHAQVGWILMALVGIHLGAAILHKIICCDKVTKRMSLFSF